MAEAPRDKEKKIVREKTEAEIAAEREAEERQKNVPKKRTMFGPDRISEGEEEIDFDIPEASDWDAS